MPSHTHQDFKEKLGMIRTAGYIAQIDEQARFPYYDYYLFHSCDEQNCQCDEMQQGHKHKQVGHFQLPAKTKQAVQTQAS